MTKDFEPGDHRIRVFGSGPPHAGGRDEQSDEDEKCLCIDAMLHEVEGELLERQAVV